ncbi:MAPEG family protein [Aestuariicella sp. G3-2]|uniref:MAPEG family protein n=1 Tax=Pseudomaricurvus albidus TaxID=2842452 RepID=UPI001C0B7D10|nr:MAPEG family protein [Aestuariicella albida]MBU3068913.1 MAPEG family protein [Aestuariicella albida]
MSQSIIFQPLLTMLILTGVVWLVLFIRRMSYLVSQKIDAEQLKTPSQVSALIPDNVESPANNFKNLFEVPVVFYVVCIAAFLLGQVDGLLVNLAWAFVILRVIHSLVHCSYNRVQHRFMAYLGSSIVVWVMVGKVALATF